MLGAYAASADAGPAGPPRPHRHVPRPTPAAAGAGLDHASVDPRVLRRLDRDGTVDVLVTVDGSSALAQARAAALGDAGALLRRTESAYRALKAGLHARIPDVHVLEDYDALPIQFLKITSRDQLGRLRADPYVIGIGADTKDRAFLAQSLPLIGQPPVAAAGFTGAGTAVAVLDSGVDYTRPAFGSCSAPGTPGCRVAVAQDFAPDDGMRDDPAAGFHGSNVSGIVVGVAPGTKVLGLDVFNGLTSNTATQVSAINFVIAQQATYNIRAINMSFGSNESFNTTPCGDPADARVTAFANARAAGIVPVVAAGNSRVANGSTHLGISRPACMPGALPVGAVYDGDTGAHTWGGPNADDRCTDATSAADRIVCFSQVWNDPMMLAPGPVISAAGVSQSGTSQAAPHVAGAVAVLFAAAGTSSVAAVQDALSNAGPSIVDPLAAQAPHRLDLQASIGALGVTTSPPPTTPPTGPCTIQGTPAGERLEGTPGDDVICGEGGDDILVTSAGNDTVIGGPGFDFVSIEGATGGGTVDLDGRTATAPGLSATLGDIEGAVGSPFGDSLFGNGGDNEFYGFGGDDSIDGGAGFDFAHYDFAEVRIKADLGRGTASGDGTDAPRSIEGLVGGPERDALNGNGRSNTLVGLGGDDRLFGLGRPDALAGGAGADDLFGGGGNDRLAGGPGRDRCDAGPRGATTSSC